jgi:HK97 family phage major capsid protein
MAGTDTLVKELITASQNNAKSIDALTKSFNAHVEQMKRTPAGGQLTPYDAFGLPNIRHGEDSMGSRGFSFMKMLGLITGAVEPHNAKVEVDIHNRLHKVYTGGNTGYNYGGGHRPGEKGFLAPLATSFMQEDVVPREFRREMKGLVRAGNDGADLDEMTWIRRKMLERQGYGRKDLSWLNELTGGALVAPPEMGELIELLRNKEALVNAGARVVPLPPQGRLKFPRQTAASNTYWIGENKRIEDSDIGTGEVTLQAKKLAVLIKAPNELIRFASPAAEALMRDDMTKSLALGLDLAGLEGAGGDTRPRGLINMPLINRITSSSPGISPAGDKLVAEDIYRMVAAIEESNAEFEGWIMRPKTWFKYLQLRADAVAQGDRQGMFLFNAIREPGDGAKPSLATYPVTKSTQVSQVRSKTTAAGNLTYITGGMWSDLLIGMFGAIEFSATNSGDTTFANDQTWVKGILSADIAARHEAAFVLMDNLDTTI